MWCCAMVLGWVYKATDLGAHARGLRGHRIHVELNRYLQGLLTFIQARSVDSVVESKEPQHGRDPTTDSILNVSPHSVVAEWPPPESLPSQVSL